MVCDAMLAEDHYASIYKVSYPSPLATGRRLLPVFKYRCLPSIQLAPIYGATTKGDITSPPKGPHRRSDRERSLGMDMGKLDTALPQLVTAANVTSTATDQSNYSNQLRSGCLAADSARLAKSVRQKYVTSTKAACEESALPVPQRGTVASLGLEPHADPMRRNYGQTHSSTGCWQERSTAWNERQLRKTESLSENKASFTLPMVSIKNSRKMSATPKRFDRPTHGLPHCANIIGHSTTTQWSSTTHSAMASTVHCQKSDTNSNVEDLVTRLSMSPRGASLLRPTPGYAGFIPRSPVQPAQEPQIDSGLCLTSLSSVRPLPSSEYKVLPFAHKGPLSRTVTLTRPFNPFMKIRRADCLDI